MNVSKSCVKASVDDSVVCVVDKTSHNENRRDIPDNHFGDQDFKRDIK